MENDEWVYMPHMQFLMKSKLSRKARLLYDEIYDYGYNIYYVPAHFGYYGVNNGFHYLKSYVRKRNKVIIHQYMGAYLGFTHPFAVCHYKTEEGYDYYKKTKFVVISSGAIKIWDKFHKPKHAMLTTLSHELAHVRLFEDKFLKAQHNSNYFEEYHGLRFYNVYTDICNEYNIRDESGYYLN